MMSSTLGDVTWNPGFHANRYITTEEYRIHLKLSEWGCSKDIKKSGFKDVRGSGWGKNKADRTELIKLQCIRTV